MHDGQSGRKLVLQSKVVVPPRSLKMTSVVSLVPLDGEEVVIQPDHDLRGLMAPNILQKATSEMHIMLRNPTDNFLSMQKADRSFWCCFRVGCCVDDSILEEELFEVKSVNLRNPGSEGHADVSLPDHIQDLFKRSTEQLDSQQTAYE